MQRDKPSLRAGPALHIHHAERHAGNIQGSDVKDLHGSDESLVECTPKDPMGIESLFEKDEVHRWGHRVFGFGVLRNSNVNPREPALDGPFRHLVHNNVDWVVLLIVVKQHIVEAEGDLLIACKHQ